MKKKFKSTLFVLMAALMGSSSLYALPIVKLNGQKVFMEQSPKIQNGTCMVSIEAMEKAIGKDVTNKTGFMPAKEFVSLIDGKLIWNNLEQSVDIEYEVEGDTDPYGRIIRKSNLPKNADIFSYILNTLPNQFYEKPLNYQKGNWLVTPVEGQHYVTPVNMSKYESVYSKEHIDNWTKTVSDNLKYRLNFSHITIGNEWAEKLVNTYPKTHKESYLKDINRYIKYVKDNKISIEGDYYVEPSTFYVTNGSYYVRCYVKFKISTPKNIKDVYLYQQLENPLKPNTWYEGIVDISVATNVMYSDGAEMWIDTDWISYDVKPSKE